MFLTHDDKHVLQALSPYSRIVNKVQYSKACSKEEIVWKIVAVTYTYDVDFYEICVVQKPLMLIIFMF